MTRIDRPYVGIPSFLRAPICEDLARLDAAIAVYGVPFDEGSPFLPGSRMGPRALREHSLRFTGGLYDPATRRDLLATEMAGGMIADIGDVDIAPTNVEKSFENITRTVRAILDRGALPVGLGGDHSITYPIFRAFDQPLHILHFDAHMDYADEADGLRFTNGHAFRHMAGLDTALSLTQVGIRSLRSERSQHEAIEAAGNRVVPMPEFRRLGAAGIAALLPAGEPVYVSIDIDALDMSLVPGCVSGEPDGMTYPELRDTLQAVAERNEIAGFDLVEVNPPLDVGTGATAYLAATIVIGFLGEICAQPRWREAHPARS
ncbi:MAG: arginase family protein [Aurantimonas endophytica]|uniref:Agmatinase n=1 Tax=Aurantimonas endophytica TaxID=1522175 RepID=A0A7W6MQ77_9HYPH|nr:arginase family protein [Aurantimonas endophytica]MBB4003647.1 agmatinase [Aurantimonas endophytica]MCO6404505.1 arginase [Aurantimonas endophytica]